MQQSIKLMGGVARAGLPVAEWFAENAYLSPGMHRLMTTTGLMTGLVSGRYAMNVLTAQDNAANRTHPDEVPLPFRQFHGLYRYQRFDNSPSARWHQVVYDVAPIALGAVGAMIGSTRYSSTTRFAQRLSSTIAKGEFGLPEASFLSGKIQAGSYNKMAGVSFGFGSSAGFHLFPWPLSTTTNAIRFQLENGKKPMLWGIKTLFGNRGPRTRDLFTSVMDVVDWAESNAAHQADADWFNRAEAIQLHARSLLQSAPHATAEHLAQMESFIGDMAEKLNMRALDLRRLHPEKSVDAIKSIIKEDTVSRALMKELGDIENRYVKMGLIDPANPEKSGVLLGDHGAITTLARWMGASEKMGEVEKIWHQAIRHRYGFADKPALPSAALMSYNDFTPKVLAYGGAGLAAISGMAALGSREKAPQMDEASKEKLANLPRHEAANRYQAWQATHPPFSIAHTINQKPLEAAEWVASVAAAAPNLHRFMNAATLSAFLYTGAKFSTALTARGLRGEAVAQADVWPIFKPVYGKMAFAWKSGLPIDRWKWTAQQLIPVAAGAMGTYFGSHLYFGNKEKALKNPTTLEDTTEAILMHESESFSKTSAISSVLNTGSGFHLLPFVSYGSNLNNRFLMANGQQVCSPILGNWWSGNPSYYPEHVKGLLKRLQDCATQSPDEYPMELAPIADATIAKLYPQLPDAERQQKTNLLVDAVYAVRDPFWQEGGMSDAQKIACHTAMEQHFRGAGFERTLTHLGLNPLEAALDHNGVSGAVAKWLGATGAVNADIASYQTHAEERLHGQPTRQIQDAKNEGRAATPPNLRQMA